jgi:plastocyanin
MILPETNNAGAPHFGLLSSNFCKHLQKPEAVILFGFIGYPINKLGYVSIIDGCFDPAHYEFSGIYLIIQPICLIRIRYNKNMNFLLAHGGRLDLFDFENPEHTVTNILLTVFIGLIVAAIVAMWVKMRHGKLSLKNLLIITLGVSIMFYLYLAERQTRLVLPQASKQVEQAPSMRVELTDNGYQPQEVTIKAGQNVAWTNKTNYPMWVASDPHPAHNGLAGFDQGKLLRKGKTWQFTFSKPGKFSYHDHLNPTRRGTVIVER